MQGEADLGYAWGALPAQFCHAMLMLLTAAALAPIPMGAARNAADPPPLSF